MATEDGSSRLVDAELELSESVISEGVPPLQVSELLGASAVVFLEDPGDSPEYQFHPAPAKVLVIILDGTVSVETGDGDRREFTPGDVVLVEDTTGRGHLSKPMTDGTRMAMLILSEED